MTESPGPAAKATVPTNGSGSAGGQTPQPLIEAGDVDQLGELLRRRRRVLAADPLPAAAAEGGPGKQYRNDVPTHETAHSSDRL